MFTNQTHYIPLDTTSSAPTYLFIDDVALYEINDTLMTADAGNNRKICRGQSVTLGKHNFTSYKYRWRPATGLSDTASGQPLASPLQTTTYYLTQTTFNDSTSKDSVTVTVNDCNPDTKIYPNPAEDDITVEFTGDIPPDISVQLSNALGQVLIRDSFAIGERKKLLNTAPLADGVYFCRVFSGKEMVKCVKVIRYK